MARSGRAREEIDRIPKLVRRYKEAVLTAAISGKLTMDWRSGDKKGAQTALVKEPYSHEVKGPKEWKRTSLGEICQFEGGSQPPKATFKFKDGPGLVRLIQIRDYKIDRFKTYIPIELAKRFCTKDDVMIGRYGPPIFQILRGIEGAYNVALMKAVPLDSDLDRNYLYYLLSLQDKK